LSLGLPRRAAAGQRFGRPFPARELPGDLVEKWIGIGSWPLVLERPRRTARAHGRHLSTCGQYHRAFGDGKRIGCTNVKNLRGRRGRVTFVGIRNVPCSAGNRSPLVIHIGHRVGVSISRHLLAVTTGTFPRPPRKVSGHKSQSARTHFEMCPVCPMRSVSDVSGKCPRTPFRVCPRGARRETRDCGFGTYGVGGGSAGCPVLSRSVRALQKRVRRNVSGHESKRVRCARSVSADRLGWRGVGREIKGPCRLLRDPTRTPARIRGRSPAQAVRLGNPGRTCER
jgi:hypothetical protein